MTNSQKRKRIRRKRRNERRIIENRKCKVCGVDLKDTVHHFLCNRHWNMKNKVKVY